MNAPQTLTGDMILVLVLIGLTVLLFIVEWVRIDVVALLMMEVLPMLGLVSGEEAFAGLASNAVVSIIAVIIIGHGLDHTRVVGRLVRPVVRLAGRSPGRVMALMSATVAVVSSFMQNIGAAALFLPALRRVTRQTGIPLSRLLMPVGFAAILGGTVTLVGSSPLILLNDLLAPFGLEPFGLFSVTPVGLLLVAAGIGYFLVLGRWVLPVREEGEEVCGFDPTRDYPLVGRLFELVMPANASETPRVMDLCDQFWVHPVALSPDGGHTRFLPPDRETPIPPGSVLAAYGPPDKVQEMARRYGMEIRPDLELFADELASDVAGVVEAVVTPRSPFVGRTIGEVHFRHHYHVTPLAVMRRDRIHYHRLRAVRLEPGDAILMHGTWERFYLLRMKRYFLYSHPIDHEIMHPHKAAAAVACFALAMGLVIFSPLKLSVCLMAGAVGMILTGVLSVDEAYRAVDWRTVFLLAGLIPLGLATEKSGTAAWLAARVLELLGEPSPLELYLAVGVLSTVFTLVISNVGAVVLLVPLVVSLAQDAGADPRLAALIVGLATSNSFLLPTHQVNALYMGPGRYTSRDFLRAGGPLSLVFLAVMTLCVWLFY